MNGEYTFQADGFQVTSQVKRDFDEYGYIIVRGMFDDEELTVLKGALEHDEGIAKHAYKIDDGEGRKTRLCIWYNPGNDITGMIGRCEKIVNTTEKLLESPIYHFHTKLMMKDAYVGGKHVWHQDYGYWYQNGFLFPDMATVFIAIDKADKTNGCLQVLKGSHKCGRVDHVMVGGQTGADLERVEQLKKHLELIHVELQPGDALFFHSNLLHCSTSNSSQFRRWAFLVAYNQAKNLPVSDDPHFKFRPLDKVSDDAIRQCTNFTDMTGKDFLDPRDDKTIVYTEDKK